MARMFQKRRIWIQRTVVLDPKSAEILEELLKVSDKSASALFREKIREEAMRMGVIENES